MLIKDIMQTNLITVDKDESLANVVELMKKHSITKFPVMDEGKFVGIVSDEEIVNKLGAIRQRMIPASSLKVSSVTIKEVRSVGPLTNLNEVVETCKKGKIGMLPILENGELQGILTRSDLLELVQSDKPLGEVIKKEIYSVLPDDRLVHARRIMIDRGVERLPVLGARTVIGIIGSMDIAMFLAYFKDHVPVRYQKARIKNLRVEDAMRGDVVVAEENQTAREAAKIMAKENIGCLPVVDTERKIRGIISRTDLIRLI
jgi:CBS domain-containing protein